MTSLWLQAAGLLPVGVVSLAAMLMLGMRSCFRASPGRWGGRRDLLFSWMSLVAVVICAVWSVQRLLGEIAPDPLTSFRFDSLAAVSTLLVALAAAGVILLSSTYLTSYRLPQAEYHALILLSLAGSFLAFGAEHLLVLVVGLELATLPIVALAGFDFGRRVSGEAAQKAFFAAASSSAVLLYGVAFLYGSSGHLDYVGLQANLNPREPMALAGLALVFAGLAMKLGLVPFHHWLPDVAQGAPTLVSVYLVVCGLMTGALAWLRLMLHGLPEMQWLVSPLFSALAVATLFFANFMALFQRNLKRMLAWLAVAQLGTFMFAFAVHSREAYVAMLFYLAVQAASLLGSFGVVMTTAEGGRERDRLENFAGIAGKQKALAVAMTIFMLALAGIPGTAGFWARWQLLSSVVTAGDLGLVVSQTLASVMALYTCMRVPVTMFMSQGVDVGDSGHPSTSELSVLGLCAVVVIGLGLWPDPEIPGRTGLGLLELLRSSIR